MNMAWRISVCVLLAVTAVVCSHRFLVSYNRAAQRAAQRYDTPELSATEAATAAAASEATDTNAVAAGTTNATVAAAGTETNAPATNAVPGAARPPQGPAVAEDSPKGLYAALALGSLIGLGLMVGREVANYIGYRVQREIYGEASEPVGDPEYDEAEQVWANGDHLEAVRLLRDFLNKKPQKLHAAFRIAEIYEKDLHNPLAAALEYEEILRHQFDPERWGWAAIHLVNLYNRLDQAAKGDALLQRVAAEYSQTAAGAKARERLGLPEQEAAPAEGEAASPPPDDGSFRLPPGFKPK